MAFFMIRVIFAIVFSFVFRTIYSLESTSKTESSLDVPLLDSLEAPLKAQLDITKLTQQLKTLIANEVRKKVNHACSELVQSLVDTKTKEATETLKTLVYDKIKSEESIGFTAFGKGFRIVSSGAILKFPDVQSSFQMSNLTKFANDGEFKCEKSGLYLLSITVMTCSVGDSVFDIYKGATQISEYYIGRSASSSDECNSATGTILLHLYANDTVSVKAAKDKMWVYEKWSSFTLLKIE